MKLPRHVLATVELYRPEDGGRAGALLARPWLVDIRIGHETRIHYHTRVDIEEALYPGEVRRAYLAFGYPDRVGPLLQPGTQIFYGLSRPVGEGTILELYFSDDERKGDGLSVDERIAGWEEDKRIGVENMKKALDALIERRTGLTEGIREVLRWANEARGPVGSLLTPFQAVDSETKHFPVGDVRQYWHEHRLVGLDAERRVLEERHEAGIMQAARRLRRFLDTKTE